LRAGRTSGAPAPQRQHLRAVALNGGCSSVCRACRGVPQDRTARHADTVSRYRQSCRAWGARKDVIARSARNIRSPSPAGFRSKTPFGGHGTEAGAGPDQTARGRTEAATQPGAKRRGRMTRGPRRAARRERGRQGIYDLSRRDSAKVLQR